MMTPEHKASRAKSILEDPVFKEAVKGVKEFHTSTFLRANASEDEVLEARGKILALTEVVNELVKYVVDDKLSKERMEKHRG